MQKLVAVRRNQNQEGKFKDLDEGVGDCQKRIFTHTWFFRSYHVFNLIVSSNQKSFLECRHVHEEKLRNLIPCYKPETSLDSRDPEKWFLIFLLILCYILKKVYCVEVLGLLYRLKRLIKQIFNPAWTFVPCCLGV